MHKLATSLLKILQGVFLAVFLFSAVLPISVSAQSRDYRYEHIEYVFTVNKDSTVEVTERQEFDFTGEYHVGYRDIPLKSVGSISNVEVVDALTGVPLVYSNKRLEGNDPKHWGKYTYWQQNSKLNIEWYFDRTNIPSEKREWLLKYKLHGAISFFKNHDELYWNLVESYEKPIGLLTAKILLPGEVVEENMFGAMYSSMSDGVSAVPSISDNEFLFTQLGVLPNEKVTVAAGWPKGVVMFDAYLNDLLRDSLGWIIGTLIVLASICYAYFYQVLAPRKFGRGTIIAEYAPPDNLRPAEVGVLLNEQVGLNVVPATIVDLAVRKYLLIEEDRGGKETSAATESVHPIVQYITQFISKYLVPTQYILKKLDVVNGQDELRPYEKQLLEAIFSNGDTYSTREMMKMSNRASAAQVSQKITALSSVILDDTLSETGAFQGSFKRWRIAVIIAFVMGWVAFLFGVGAAPSILNVVGDFVAILIALIIATAVIALARLNPRLNSQGQLKKESWLGFKLYLETAERYRLQGLSPEQFEKYLPYAMIFNVEKKWSEAFVGMSISDPSWYRPSGVTLSNTNNALTPAFSASAFTRGFSASFASAVNSSGGGGASGGGHAGGGGGGGGGGAR